MNSEPASQLEDLGRPTDYEDENEVLGRLAAVASSLESTTPSPLDMALRNVTGLGRWVLIGFDQGGNEPKTIQELADFYYFETERIMELGREATTALVEQGLDTTQSPLSDWIRTFGVNEKPTEAEEEVSPKTKPIPGKKKLAPEPFPKNAAEILTAWEDGKLSERQINILVLMAEGSGLEEIAEILGYRSKVIQTDKRRIFSIFGLDDTPNNQKSAKALEIAREIVGGAEPVEAVSLDEAPEEPEPIPDPGPPKPPESFDESGAISKLVGKIEGKPGYVLARLAGFGWQDRATAEQLARHYFYDPDRIHGLAIEALMELRVKARARGIDIEPFIESIHRILESESQT
ncbi:hypothetical protein A2708_00550 [Candidatus Saccharibacteria bacterium RIFCSPHIGHO2_01_FULL_49_21]|nr:MAG: hypothetical protein A2708_00550 [Candidatus Saccharibacteria bacterium RIFCSPHIGHO2_01_FULL_49_21]OGL38637.1 MAG: hypothetical protein A3B63_01160 [Candidatus Saccharibacteria bacterium RIFCSPLOWO2_01_FULL_49_22]